MSERIFSFLRAVTSKNIRMNDSGKSGDKDFYKIQKFKNERVLSRSAFSFKLLMLFLVSYTRWRSLDRAKVREGEDLLQITADLRVKVSRCEAWNE